eukprot:273996-Rhodomonas_salina.1
MRSPARWCSGAMTRNHSRFLQSESGFLGKLRNHRDRLQVVSSLPQARNTVTHSGWPPAPGSLRKSLRLRLGLVTFWSAVVSTRCSGSSWHTHTHTHTVTGCSVSKQTLNQPRPCVGSVFQQLRRDLFDSRQSRLPWHDRDGTQAHAQAERVGMEGMATAAVRPTCLSRRSHIEINHDGADHGDKMEQIMVLVCLLSAPLPVFPVLGPRRVGTKQRTAASIMR